MPRILVIDDLPEMRRLFREILEGEGHEVRCASNGTEGVRLYRELPAEVVICDVLMPEPNGLQTIEELIGAFPDARVIATSAAFIGRDDLTRAAVRIGAVRLLKKPFGLEELLAAVNEVNRPE